MVPKLLNFVILTPFFTRLFKYNIEEYGKVTELYAYIVFLMILLTYGMETAYFRYVNIEKSHKKVFSTIFTSILVTTAIFIFVIFYCTDGIASALKYEGEAYFIKYLGGILAIETLSAIPFAKLRIENKARKFAILKIVLVVLNIGIMLFYYKVSPKIFGSDFILNADKLVSARFIFISNFIASTIVFIFLIPECRLYNIKYFNFSILKRVYIYGIPLLVSGLGGVINETLDRSIFKHVFANTSEALYQLGVYGANYKLASVILIVVQMFRYAAEPFFFNYEKQKDSKERYAQVMHIFVGITLFMGLGILLFLNIARYFIASTYYSGLRIVPLIVLAYVLYGILFNLSVWFKLSNKTQYAIIITTVGALITITVNLIFLPEYGYYAAAVGHVTSYFVMVIISYILSRKYYLIPYNVPRITGYILLAVAIYFVDRFVEIDMILLSYLFKLFLLVLFSTFVIYKENLIEIFFKRSHEG